VAASFRVYIDESGDEGFSFGGGSTEWFVLSAVITRMADDLAAVKVVDTVRELLGRPPRKPLHFKDMRHEHRLPYVDAISRQPLRVVTVLVRKPSLRDPRTFRGRYKLYFRALHCLLENVSRCCNAQWNPIESGDPTAQIVLSNRAGLSRRELRSWLAGVRLDPSVIHPDHFEVVTPGRRMGLQIADAAASSFFCAVQPSRLGFTEERYVRMLRPVVHEHEGCCFGHGLTLLPEEAARLLDEDTRLLWIKQHYLQGMAGSGS